MSDARPSSHPRRRSPVAVAAAAGIPLLLAAAVALFLLLPSAGDRRGVPSPDATRSARIPAALAPGGAASGRIAGVVVDRAGRGVPGARVAAIVQGPPSGLILRLSEARPAIELPAVVVAGEGGRFEIPGLAPGRYILTATARAFTAGHHRPIELTAGADVAGVEVRLGEGGFTLDGRVVDLGGGVVAGARVRAIAAEVGRAEAQKLVFETVSDEAGGYSLGLAAGRYALFAEADGYAPAHDFADVDGKETRQIRLQPAGAIAGRVVTAGGEGVPGAEVRVEPLDRPEEEFGRAVVSDERGAFALSGLVAGTYRVVARQGELVGSSRMPVRLAVAGRKDDLEIALARGVTLEGMVKREGGEPVDNATVWAVPEDLTRAARPVHRRVTCDASGKFRLDGLLGGTYRVRAHAPGYTSKEEPISMIEPGVLRRDIILAEEVVVAGQVVDASGAPVARAQVEGQVRPRRPGPVLVDRTETDDGGQFVLRGLTPGDLRLGARTEAGVVNSPVHELEAGHTRRFTLRLGRGARLSGTVAWDDGLPAANVLVIAQSRGVGITHLLEVRSDGQGRFSAGPLPAGNVSIHAVPPDERVAHLASSDAPQVDLTLAEGEHDDQVKLRLLRRSETIRGMVLGPDGQPVGDALIFIEKERDGLPVTERSQRASTGADGAFVIESLARGSYTLVATHPGHDELRRPGVAAGGAPVRLVFRASASLAGVVVTSSGEPVTSFALAAERAAAPAPPPGPGGIPPAPRPPRPPEEIRSPTGEFELGALAAGTYKLTAVAPDGAAAELPELTVREGESRRGLRLVMRGGRRLRVQIRDFDSGRALAGALVEVRTPAGTTLRGAADGGGHALLAGVPRTGSLDVVFRGPDDSHAPETRELPGGDPRNDRDELDLGQIQLVRSRLPTAGGGQTGGPAALAFAPIDFVAQGDRLVVASGPPSAEAAPGGPSYHPGDVVLAVNGQDARGVGPNGMRNLLVGPPQTEVTFTLRGPDLVPREVSVPRVVGR